MNNDLEQFSEERLKELSNINGNINTRFCDADIEALARIALAAKQAKPVNSPCEKCKGSGFMDSGGTQPWGEPISVECDCTTPQPAHTEPDGWIKCSERLPDDDSFVLVTNGKHTGMGAYLRDEHLEDDEHWQDEHFEFINKQSKYPVTHWMPLPPNPEE